MLLLILREIEVISFYQVKINITAELLCCIYSGIILQFELAHRFIILLADCWRVTLKGEQPDYIHAINIDVHLIAAQEQNFYKYMTLNKTHRNINRRRLSLLLKVQWTECSQQLETFGR